MYECRFCGSLRVNESNHRVDAKHSVVEAIYLCGSILRIVFPGGEHEWEQYCRGSSSQRLDKIRKLPDK